jgi:phosphatidylserine/phosphatidylglycerophosphate/cardiolipin synthase-like enzyme
MRTAPGHVDPPTGARFNNPYGSTAQRRALVDQVITAINASPGYVRRNPFTRQVMPCPGNPKYFPSEIKIAVYSIADKRFAKALVAAQQRCVSVQVLMNSHLTVVTSPSWRSIFRHLGRRGADYRHQRSFARRCSHGCLGTAVLHSKMFLFSRPGRMRYTVMVGSTNMARNATKIQFNDLYTVNGNRQMYAQYRSVFEAMARDRTVRRDAPPRVYTAGPYTSTFYPYFHANRRTDRTMQALRSIRCSGADGGAGIGGRTVVYIAMHSWFGTRGRYLAGRVRQMYDRGCYVRILYSFMGGSIYSRLTYGTGRRMVARRVLFPGPRGVVASKYSHMKMFAASGNVAGDRSSWVVWTGSNNFSDKGPHADEVTLRIPLRSAYQAYVHHWKYMKHRRSSRYWALFEEPVGGGRAP